MSSWIVKEFNRVVRPDVSDYTIIPPISEETKRMIGEMRKNPAHKAYMKHLEGLGIVSRESYEAKKRGKRQETTDKTSSSDKSKEGDAFYKGMMNAAFRYQNKRVYGLPTVPSEEEKEIEKILIEMSRENKHKRER
jgi:hypothetical protein